MRLLSRMTSSFFALVTGMTINVAVSAEFQHFTVPGTYVYTATATTVLVRAIGGGASDTADGGESTFGEVMKAPGGKAYKSNKRAFGGSYVEKRVTGLKIGDKVTVAVGASGAGPTPDMSGKSGAVLIDPLPDAAACAAQ